LTTDLGRLAIRYGVNPWIVLFGLMPTAYVVPRVLFSFFSLFFWYKAEDSKMNTTAAITLEDIQDDDEELNAVEEVVHNSLATGYGFPVFATTFMLIKCSQLFMLTSVAETTQWLKWMLLNYTPFRSVLFVGPSVKTAALGIIIRLRGLTSNAPAGAVR